MDYDFFLMQWVGLVRWQFYTLLWVELRWWDGLSRVKQK